MIPAKATFIVEWAFYCVRPTSIVIPESDTSVGALAFHLCANLTTVSASKGLQYPPYAFPVGVVIFRELNQLLLFFIRRFDEKDWRVQKLDILADEGEFCSLSHETCGYGGMGGISKRS